MLRHLPIIALLVVLVVNANIHAKNIDLVTLPKREKVQLTIYNSEDLTLAEETRFLTLKKGLNKLQFSWIGTLIDPTSIEIRPLEHRDEIDVVDTILPGQKPNHLIWTIQSDIEGQVAVEVSYFTSGLTWQMDYVAISDSDETNFDFRGYVRVFNNSGEEYEDAEIRMIVGKVNLVEKIAALAGVPVEKLSELQSSVRRFYQRDAMQKSIEKASRAADGDDDVALGKRVIVKEGVSEYFMFSVDGTETIRNGWSKRMEAVKALDVKYDTVYRMRAFQYGPRPARFVIWKNDKESGLGENPLPNGLVRVFRKNSEDGLSYLGQQKLNYVPIQADIEVNLGFDDLVVYKRRRASTKRSDFVFHPTNRHVTGWDEEQQWVDEIRNYRGKPIQFELRNRMNGDIQLRYELPTTSFDFNTIEAKFAVPAAGQTDYPYVATVHHGSNAKQNRVKLIPEK
jgi:hypothetical protein